MGPVFIRTYKQAIRATAPEGAKNPFPFLKIFEKTVGGQSAGHCEDVVPSDSHVSGLSLKTLSLKTQWLLALARARILSW